MVNLATALYVSLLAVCYSIPFHYRKETKDVVVELSKNSPVFLPASSVNIPVRQSQEDNSSFNVPLTQFLK